MQKAVFLIQIRYFQFKVINVPKRKFKQLILNKLFFLLSLFFMQIKTLMK